MDNNTFNIIKQYIDKKVSLGLTGLSAYQVAVKNGYTGTETEWLASLSGGGSANVDLSDYATLASPAFTGNPTAPTAAKNTNTNQIATTAFVHNALSPSLLITIADFPSNATGITATITLQGSDPTYNITQIVPASGIVTFNPEFTGIYNVSFNDIKIKGQSTVNMSIPSSYNIGYNWSDSATYTLVIDKTNSNPETACSYADDATGMIKGTSGWDTMPIFKDIRPCVFSGGQVNYYLNPNNWDEKVDGTASCLTGEDGDVMIEFPKFAYKIKTEGTFITVSVSNDNSVISNDADYTYDAFSRLVEGDLGHFYKGAFKGYIDGNGKLRSIAGVKPTVGTSLVSARTAAQANGAHYQQSTYAQLKALQCLYLIKYGNRDSQTAAGVGYTVVGSSNTSYITNYNAFNTDNIANLTSLSNRGMNYAGYTNTHMRLFGIEDFWGNVWEWIEGIKTANNDWVAILSWNNFLNEGASISEESVSFNLPTNAANQTDYALDVSGDTKTGFLMTAKGGSTSTYWPDCQSFNRGKVLNHGGRWTYGPKAGLFCFNFANAADVADTNTGARLSYV